MKTCCNAKTLRSLHWFRKKGYDGNLHIWHILNHKIIMFFCTWKINNYSRKNRNDSIDWIGLVWSGLVWSGQRNHICHLPKHFHNMPPPPLPLVFNVESVVALLPLFKLLSSHFLLLIKSRFTLTLSRKCGHSMFANLINL